MDVSRETEAQFARYAELITKCPSKYEKQNREAASPGAD